MITQNIVNISIDNKTLCIGNDLPLTIIAGPCAMESKDHAMTTAGILHDICQRLGIGLIYKSSFDKANRTSALTKRGIGLTQALPIFADIRKAYNIPVITDIHMADHCDEVASVVDVLQIPAFLCRQTDLLQAAAVTGKAIHVKKGQFLAPWDMKNVVNKIRQFGNNNILVCERGVSFGYNTLVVDMRSLVIMAETTFCPIVFDATHSVQQPGGRGDTSGGERRFVEIMARAAVAVGISTVFMETHEDPDNAPSDGPNMVPLNEIEGIITRLMQIDKIVKNYKKG